MIMIMTIIKMVGPDLSFGSGKKCETIIYEQVNHHTSTNTPGLFSSEWILSSN